MYMPVCVLNWKLDLLWEITCVFVVENFSKSKTQFIGVFMWYYLIKDSCKLSDASCLLYGFTM